MTAQVSKLTHQTTDLHDDELLEITGDSKCRIPRHRQRILATLLGVGVVECGLKSPETTVVAQYSVHRTGYARQRRRVARERERERLKLAVCRGAWRVCDSAAQSDYYRISTAHRPVDTVLQCYSVPRPTTPRFDTYRIL